MFMKEKNLSYMNYNLIGIQLKEKVKIIIPEGIIQDISNNKNKEKIIQNNF